MHAGSIQNPKSAAGRVYAILLYCKDRWLSGWYLTTEARVTAVGTRVSEVRHQLPAGQRIEHKTSHDGVQGSWYRLVEVLTPGDATMMPEVKPGFMRVYNDTGKILKAGALVKLKENQIIEDTSKLNIEAATNPSDTIVGILIADLENLSYGECQIKGQVMCNRIQYERLFGQND